jgi:hypothetical protein
MWESQFDELCGLQEVAVSDVLNCANTLLNFKPSFWKKTKNPFSVFSAEFFKQFKQLYGCPNILGRRGFAVCILHQTDGCFLALIK